MHTLCFRNDDKMPALGLGTWKSEPGQVYSAVKDALNAGYRHIDCAPIYGNEVEIGEAFTETFAAGRITRKQVWVTSKLWNNAHAPEDVEPALKKILADLQVNYLDLFLIHWPVHFINEVLFPREGGQYIAYEKLPITETWQVMEELVDKGLVRHIGVSNFSIAKLDELSKGSRIKPEMNQIELHPYLQQPAMLKYCHENNILLTAYSPLGSPDRPAALKANDEPLLLNEPAIAEIAARHQATVAQVLISWALQRGTAVIPKSVTQARIIENFEAADLTLSSEECEQLNRLDRNMRYVTGAFWTGGGSPYTLENLWDKE